jgi:cytochrome c-type biogenesis protein
MAFGPQTYALSALAGALSTLSPCVLPLIPIVIGSAMTAHRRGPLALAAGLTLSFAVVGILIAYAGATLGFGSEAIRKGGALVLGVFGIVLISAQLQQRYAHATARLSSAGQSLLSHLPIGGLSGQFLVGLVLGVIWSPCVGPTLGAAIGLASQGEEIGRISLVMLLFGFGASVPVVILGSLGHSMIGSMRASLLRAGHLGKAALGMIFVVLAVGVITGADHHVESWIVDHSPAWLTDLTTRY